MIHFSSIGGFSSPPNNDLLAFRVEGFVAFKELDLRLRLTPMSFVFTKVLRSGFKKEEDKEEMQEMKKGEQFLSLYTLGNYSFPSKKSCSKVKHFFKIVDTCQQGEELKSLTKSVSKSKMKNRLHRYSEKA